MKFDLHVDDALECLRLAHLGYPKAGPKPAALENATHAVAMSCIDYCLTFGYKRERVASFVSCYFKLSAEESQSAAEAFNFGANTDAVHTALQILCQSPFQNHLKAVQGLSVMLNTDTVQGSVLWREVESKLIERFKKLVSNAVEEGVM